MEGETLDQDHCEPLEEVLKRVQFNRINLEGTSLSEEVLSRKLYLITKYFQRTNIIGCVT